MPLLAIPLFTVNFAKTRAQSLAVTFKPMSESISWSHALHFSAELEKMSIVKHITSALSNNELIIAVSSNNNRLHFPWENVWNNRDYLWWRNERISEGNDQVSHSFLKLDHGKQSVKVKRLKVNDPQMMICIRLAASVISQFSLVSG